ncbi:RNA-guided endonuclease TnpB family protein [Streptomyces sp. NPDC002039]|uniref:RNA-guided endonuclease InsQ/TnpB family protein n=1 Tax=Streptomyces sp. NPDC002039 TaxID=3154660 RepID=UPI00331CD1A3
MMLRYNYRVYPNGPQRLALARAFGCARVVWNDCLSARRAAREAGLPYVKSAELSKRLITRAKRTPERAWLADVSAVVLQQSLRDLDTAFKNFFDSNRGGRNGRKVSPPRYKSKKDSRHSIRLTSNAFALLADGRVYVAKVGNLATAPETLPETEAEVGIDLGLTTFAVLSDGTRISSPRFLRRAEKKLKRLHRDLSRKTKDSKNRAKARGRLARQYARVADRRRDWHHKTSTRIIRDNQAVYVEDLAVSALARTRLGKSVHDAGWTAFLNMLAYKAVKHGRYFGKIGRFVPTSQMCSACGHHDGPKPLHIRMWTCTNCATVHDRDENASHNTLAAGRADRLNACGAPVGPGAIPARRDETGSSCGGLTATAGIPGPQAGDHVNSSP